MAADLAARSDSVAARLDESDPCGARSEAQRLQADAIAAVNTGAVPRRYQEELLASVNALLGAIECAATSRPTGADDPSAKDGEAEGQGKGKAKGKKGKGKK